MWAVEMLRARKNWTFASFFFSPAPGAQRNHHPTTTTTITTPGGGRAAVLRLRRNRRPRHLLPLRLEGVCVCVCGVLGQCTTRAAVERERERGGVAFGNGIYPIRRGRSSADYNRGVLLAAHRSLDVVPFGSWFADPIFSLSPSPCLTFLSPRPCVHYFAPQAGWTLAPASADEVRLLVEKSFLVKSFGVYFVR